MRWTLFLAGMWLAVGQSPQAQSQEPLHRRIDALIQAKAKGAVSPQSSDAEFIRRIYLDFAGRIPSAPEARTFFADKSADKRVKIIDQLLAKPEYSVQMKEQFNIMWMERLPEHPAWDKYLLDSFAKNKPWDEMARELLGAAPKSTETAGAIHFLSKRLENYGQNPVDYPALTRDIGRLFLGKDLACAQCHNHLTVKEYKQRDFQGLFAFVKNVARKPGKDPGIAEKPTTAKIEFASVFGGGTSTVGPRIPGSDEIAIPAFKKGDEFVVRPDPKKKTPGVLKFSTLETLAEKLPTPENVSFNRNIVNRLWYLMLGRGLVHPLDLHHGANPPSHPELMDLLAKEFVAHKYDMKWFLRELALTEVYQRSSILPEGQKDVKPEEFRTALERRLSAEQVLRNLLEATGEKSVKDAATFNAMRPKFLAAFADAPRAPEEGFNPTLKGALFLLNDAAVVSWLTPKAGNLLDRLQKINDDGKVAEELYVSVLTRVPSAEETKEVESYLAKNKSNRPAALRSLTWALLGSTEFCVNH